MRDFNFDPNDSWGLECLVSIFTGNGPLLFTSNNEPITLGGLTWQPAPGCDLTGIQYPSDGAPANVDVQIMAVPNGILEPGDGLRGMLDGWDATVDVCDPMQLQNGSFRILQGTIGSVSEDANGLVTIGINGPLGQAKASLTEHYSILARESLGDDRCKVPILPLDIQRNQVYVTATPPSPGLLRVSDCYGRVRVASNTGAVEDYGNVYFECTAAGVTSPIAPIYNPTVGSVTNDGSAQFTARNAWLRYARGQAIDPLTIELEAMPDPRAAGDPTWFAPFSNLYIRSGPLINTRIPINQWIPNFIVVVLAQPVSVEDIPEHTQLEIHRGCNLTANVCNTIFNNIINRRGEEFVPPDLISSFSTP